MKFFRKWKEYKERLVKRSKIYDILNLTYDYKNIELSSPIQVNNIYILKKENDLIFFVKKNNWKKYIGINRDWLSDLQGNDFSQDHLYKSIDLKEIKSCYESDIPKEMIEEMYNKLIEHVDDLKNILENKKKEEFYK